MDSQSIPDHEQHNDKRSNLLQGEEQTDDPRPSPLLPSILVPTDFSTESDYALLHGTHLAKAMRIGVVLLHVLKENEDEKNAWQKIEQQVKKLSPKVPLRTIVTSGELETQVQHIAEAEQAQYIVVGSHHAKTPDSYKKSKARQLFRYGTTPFIAIQTAPEMEEFNNVIFPVDFTDEGRGKHEWLERINEFYDPIFHLVTPKVNEPELELRVKHNLQLAQSLLERVGAPFTTCQVEGLEEFSQEVLEFAHEVEGDLIIITSANDPRHPGRYMLEPHERNLLLQADDIPVMIINPPNETTS